MSPASGLRELRQLASLYGVQTAYYGVDRHRRSASADSLLAALKGLGAGIDSVADAPSALRRKEAMGWRQSLEPVTVAWEGISDGVEIRLPRNRSDSTWKCTLVLETEEEVSWDISGADLPDAKAADVEGGTYVLKHLALRQTLPWGYHRLSVEIPGLGVHQTLLISAPQRAYSPFGEGRALTWGVFLPLYALHRDQGASPYGDFSDLQEFSRWTGQLGGGIVATLPILATFLDQPFEPSPYAPISRLLWNEFYIDLSRAPELERSSKARRLLESPDFQKKSNQLRKAPLVDYREGMGLKRQVLEVLSRDCFAGPQSETGELNKFLSEQPQVEDYACFRATMEKLGKTWHSWPQRLRDGDVREGDYEENAKRYHVYAQWLAHRQIRQLAQNERESRVSLYLDLPLGVHPDGYDVWRRKDLFLEDFAVGAPPDAFFTQGQNWGFPPVHPESLRESGYDYYINYLRHHFEAANLLRIDHVLGLHRLFWIPQGMDGSQGVYVRYPAEESYAILTLESQRHQAAIIGEDLGTVPPAVRPAMRRHGLYGMYVTYFQLTGQPKKALEQVSSNTLASINTHDMPPFAAFWQDLDINYRKKLGHQSPDGARREINNRRKLKKALTAFLKTEGLLAPDQEDQAEVLRGLLSFLARSQAPMVLGNLEDLWLEESPQNIPGTSGEQPNWRQKARYSFEEFSQMPQLVEALRELDSQRRLAQQRR